MKFDKFKKKKVNLKVVATIVVAITLIGIVGISTIKNSGMSPFSIGVVSDGVAKTSSPIDSASKFIKQGISDFTNFRKNGNKMRELEKENEKLKAKIIELNSKSAKVDSLEELKKGLNYVSTDRMKSIVSGTIIEKNDGNWYESFVVNVGKNDGVEKNSIVINGKGLVGIVYEVSKNSSKAISLLDSKSAVSFKIVNNTAAKGVISNTSSAVDKKVYESNRTLNGYMFDSGYEVVQGDTIVTSGMGLYPEDIPIGEIEKVIDDKNKSLKSVVIKPYVNFKDIDDVMIIKPRKIS
ncbi:rod shape-determining protein MreC [Peptacetobacter sp.]|uniref:rod shape-determining protein MreC n=1 Tax=Peptacetobacter sp. TaxID=2991975 RepID=UPI00260238AD|nr:rod shape-determining protein MreC [Peptacetobacter sp.]